MNYKEYFDKFQLIINQSIQTYPYDNSDFLEYTKLNASRFNRWLKKGEIQEEYVDKILAIHSPQEWIIITEHWCGDAAHSIPFIVKLASLNSLISLEFQLRDDSNSEINSYLTNGSKSIPILVARQNGNDIFVWGPRPKACTEMISELKNGDSDQEVLKEAIQKWYNQDQGRSIQKEIVELLGR